jgi:hypothetical protein
MHGVVLAHAPFQPVKFDPEPPVAVSDTAVPSANVAVQTVPQLMPGGLEITEPFPSRVTFSV